MVPDDRTGGPRFAAFCERYIRHTKGRWAGMPLALEEWQRDFWWEALEVDPATGLRIYPEIGLGLPRKNGKSMQAAAAAHYFLVADGEPEPEVYVAAAARNQAGIVLGQARRIGLQSPRLRRHVRVQSHLIECPGNGGIMRALSADAALQHGLDPSANIIDELHAHRDGSLYTALTTGTLAREQPFTLWITTAGGTGTFLHDLVGVMHTGPGVLEDRGALRIYRDRRNGVLMWWYGAPAGADVADPDVWRAANPASWLRDGRVLAAEYGRLRSRGAMAEWRTYHLDQFVEELEAWMPVEAWEACSGDPVFDARLPVHACVRIAHDHRSAAVAVAQRQGERVVLRVRTFPDMPLPEGEYVEADVIEEHIRSLHARYRAPVSAEVTHRQGGPAYHRRRPGPEVLHHGAFFEPSRQRLVKQGIVMLDFPSTAERLGPAAAALMQQVTARALVHDGDPELGRQMARVVARMAPRGWSVASGTGEPVMGAIAAMLAVQRALTAPRVPVYRTSGLGG
ncbi:MAG: terminase large subunit [Chloroflexi bacterium]|nr:terminase large subunit [Chloroflexota bacterium]